MLTPPLARAAVLNNCSAGSTSRDFALHPIFRSASDTMSVGNDAPVSSLRLVEPYPSAKASKTSLTLQQITKGLPAVLHLFTG